MGYNDKMNRLEDAQNKMLQSFNKFANENNLDQDLRDQVIKILIEAVKEKRAEYYLQDKVSVVKDSMNKILSESLSKVLKLNQDQEVNSSSDKDLKINFS